MAARDALRWNADKQALYAAFLAAADHHNNDVRMRLGWIEDGMPDDRSPHEPDINAADRVRQEISLLAPAVVVTAVDVFYGQQVDQGIALIQAYVRAAGVLPDEPWMDPLTTEDADQLRPT